MTIATRGEMGLHQADGHLAYARLHLAMGDTTRARESLATARAMVTRMGYHRRDAEVQELEEQTQALLTTMWNVRQGFLSWDRHAQHGSGGRLEPGAPRGDIERSHLCQAIARACAMPTRTIYSAIWLL